MNIEKIGIGKMAELNQTTIQTLRHYDKIDLLKPAYIDDDSNYRYYDIKQSAKLDMIYYMKFLGMSLEEIKEQFDNKDISQIYVILQQQKQLISHKINELRRMSNAVETCLENFRRYKHAPRDNKIAVEHLGARKIFCYDSHKNIYDYNLDGYEYILRELKRQIVKQDLPIVYFCSRRLYLRSSDRAANISL